ncbi:hypothetical protein WN943_029785 [Citrus x changshan-huyou]
MRSKRRSPLSESKSSNVNYRVIDSLEKQNVDEYNSGLSFFYDCIKFVLKKDYLELDMNKFEAGVNAYMNDQN